MSHTSILAAGRRRSRALGLPVRPIVSIAAALVAAGLLVWSGTLSDAHDALVLMGFDPDRAQLIAALIAAAIAAAAGMAAGDDRLTTTVAGAAVALALFARTFAAETRMALASTGESGRFDPIGWILTLLTIVSVSLAIAWATAVVTSEVRRFVVSTARSSVAAAREHRLRGRPLLGAASVVALAVLVGIVAPVFGDLVNYSPDAHMRTDAQLGGGLVNGGGSVPGVTGDAAGSAGSSLTPTGSADANGLLPAISSGDNATSGAQPWLAWRTAGTGTVVRTTLPSPWVANGHPSSQVAVYLPPGYAVGSRRYPVVYEVPWSYDNWVRAIGIGGMLDQLISSGRIPPLIMVFAAHYGAPMPDTECVDSHDGRQWLETYFTKTVVGYVDANFRTIASPAARAIFGYSEGAYCSSMLALRHPEVFSTAVSMSGYFQAAIRTPVTVNAPLPFGGDQQAIVEHSPLHLASTLSGAQRDSMFFVLSADPREWLYGPQYEAMAAVLQKEHYHYLLLSTQLGHAWQATRVTLPPALQAVAGRWVATGVFAGQS